MSAGSRSAPSKARTSIADVAALAGVSMGTVSNVVNHPERVTESTRQRVERAIELLRYTPSTLARSLAVGSMRALGLVLTDLQNSLFVDISRGVDRAAQEREASLLLANSDATLESEERYLRLFAETRMLATLVTLIDTAHYRRVVRAGSPDMPLVLLNFDPGDDSHCAVHVDNALGARLAVEHLHGIGRRKIAIITQHGSLQPIAERERGFAAAMRDAGLRPSAEVGIDDLSRADGYRAGLELLPLIESGEVDGVFAMADLVAAGVAQAVLSNSSLRIPDDLAIVGYDDNRSAWDSPTPLTTIAQPGDEVGYTGAMLAFEEIEDEHHLHRTIALEPHLLVRTSTVR